MRVAASIGVFAIFLAVPYVAARAGRLLSAHQQIVLATATLVGLTAGFLGFLGAIVTPSGLGIPEALGAVEFCLVAGAKLFQHPLKHWPSIAAAFLLVTFVVRLGLGTVLTVRDSRRADPARGASSYRLVDPYALRLVPTSEPIAYTTGILRPKIVMSEGLFASLSEGELLAVVAHERAHARGMHLPLLFLARVVGRSFKMIPPVRKASEQLVTALESSADDAAVEAVGDRLVVLQAMQSVAQARQDELVLGMGGGSLGARARRIARPSSPIAGGKVGLALVSSVIGIAIIATALAWVAGSDAVAHELIALDLHQVCHLPH